MTVEGIRKATEYFLETMDSEGVYEINSKFFEEHVEHFKNWSNRRNSFHHVLKKITPLIDGKITDEEGGLFMIQIMIWNLASMLELFKFFLMVVTNKDRIKFNPDKAMYGQVIGTICKEMNYDEKTRKTTLDNFMVDFRNAIFHNNYSIGNFQVTYQNYNNQAVVLTLDQLNERNSEATAMFEVISGFAEKKNSELGKGLE
ncbi:MAG: hypothetical protein HQ505_00200 [Nitrosopumilus sp.]|nr:hypothetical protein [Nitrosopumilus sp.]